jgi:hypothetical protein
MNDYCSAGTCQAGSPPDCDDGDPCTEDHCDPDEGCIRYNTVGLCEDGDFCTINDQCNGGLCVGSPDPECPWEACEDEAIVDGEGQSVDYSYTRVTRVIIPQGHGCVWVRAYYFSREYPVYTGQGSQFNDELSYAVSSPGGTIASGETTVNALDSAFEDGPYPGGTYKVYDQMLDYGSHTATGDSWIDLRGTATNVTDGELGSGVAFRVKCCGVVSLTWERAQVHPENTALDTCPSNGGKRVFPGKLDPNDGHPEYRQDVDLVATVVPADEGQLVYFKVWDVDDPFDQNNPDMLNVGLIDNDASGPDNRGLDPAPYTYSAPTDAEGKARVSVTVSMQPGNNYRGGASTNLQAVLSTSQSEADTNARPIDVRFSEMLTVWRKLHVEVDSMARPTFAENTISTEWNEPRFPSGKLTLDISDQYDTENFENGFIRVKADGFPDLIARIITYRQSILDDEVDTNVTQSQWGARPGSGDCTLSDDDLADEARFTAGLLGSDIGLGTPPSGYLPIPDTGALEDAYKNAYILPVVDIVHSPLSLFPFIKNMDPETKSQWDPPRLARIYPVSTAPFWTVYVFSAFQAEANEDADAELTNTKGANTHENGSTSAFWLWGSGYTGMVAVYQEVIRDAYPSYQEQRTVAHEIAHTLGIPHLGADSIPGDGGLMDKTEQGPDFYAESLRDLRKYVEP